MLTGFMACGHAEDAGSEAVQQEAATEDYPDGGFPFAGKVEAAKIVVSGGKPECRWN